MADISDVAPQDDHLSLLDLLGPANQPHERRLADAIRTDQAHHAARWDVDGDVVQGDGAAILVGHGPDRRHGLRWARHRGHLGLGAKHESGPPELSGSQGALGCDLGTTVSLVGIAMTFLSESGQATVSSYRT